MYVLKGSCRINTDDGIHTLKKGDFVFLNANAGHDLKMDNNENCLMLNMEFGFTKRTTPTPSISDIYYENDDFKQFYKAAKPYVYLRDDRNVLNSLRRLILELDMEQPSQILIKSLLAEIIITISRMYTAKESLKGDLQENYSAIAVNYINTHYYDKLPINKIASVVNIHPGYLYRVFKKQTGMTPNQYITDVRMEKARMLLKNTNIPIIEISSYVGLSSPQYFDRLFKKTEGITPGQYRNKSSNTWERDTDV